MAQSLMPGHANNPEGSKLEPRLSSVPLGTCALCTFFTQTAGANTEIQISSPVSLTRFRRPCRPRPPSPAAREGDGAELPPRPVLLSLPSEAPAPTQGAPSRKPFPKALCQDGLWLAEAPRASPGPGGGGQACRGRQPRVRQL